MRRPLFIHRPRRWLRLWGTKNTHLSPLEYPMSDSDADQFLRKAKRAVIDAKQATVAFRPDDLYVVWFAKVLGNWKALISTDIYNGAYWEVTYNGAKQETYVDAYVKKSNVCIPD